MRSVSARARRNDWADAAADAADAADLGQFRRLHCQRASLGQGAAKGLSAVVGAVIIFLALHSAWLVILIVALLPGSKGRAASVTWWQPGNRPARGLRHPRGGRAGGNAGRECDYSTSNMGIGGQTEVDFVIGAWWKITAYEPRTHRYIGSATECGDSQLHQVLHKYIQRSV